MKLRILLVNPWIYDVAAANLWSRPLGLLKVAEWLSAFDVELSLIDCTGSFRGVGWGRGKYPKHPVAKPDCLKPIPRTFGRYGIAVDEFRKGLREKGPFDLVFITSLMSYWYPGIQAAIGIIREEYGNIPVVLGGIYATLWERHASENSGADFIYRGPAGEELKFIFNTFGFRLKKIRGPVPYRRLGLYTDYPFAPLLTGTGCPFSCAYCASSVLQRKFARRETSEVVQEIRELYDSGVRDFAFYDDALLFDPDRHIKPVLKKIVGAGLIARFHCPNGLHARFVDDDLAGLMKASGFKTIRLGLETVNPERQKQSGGKITSEDLEHAVQVLKRRGFAKEEVGVYLMYGLPGQGLGEVREGIRFLESLGVRIHLTEFSPIPGTEYWRVLEEKGIVGENTDPLLTNNSVFSYLFSGYDPHEIDQLKLGVKKYNFEDFRERRGQTR
ncbi:MAG: B12-binding domain-containing radical SAM protein [Nitrospiraceae bacterium]|nr:B12-binding domain-containing radical SAM protein [Nitrospiraceae bacterium]